MQVEWQRLSGQVVRGPAGETRLSTQLLPVPVWRAYQAMSRAMEAELGSRLLVGSGYRSPAYQLFVPIAEPEGPGPTEPSPKAGGSTSTPRSPRPA